MKEVVEEVEDVGGGEAVAAGEVAENQADEEHGEANGGKGRVEERKGEGLEENGGAGAQKLGQGPLECAPKV